MKSIVTSKKPEAYISEGAYKKPVSNQWIISTFNHASISKDKQNYFASMIPKGKDWFTPKEVAAIVGRTDQSIRNALDNRKIFVHTLNSRAKKGLEKRHAYIIHRDSVILFLLKTANYQPREVMEGLKEIMENRSCSQLEDLFRWLKIRMESI